MPVHAHQPRLVAEPAEPQRSAPELFSVEPDGHGIQLCRGVQEARPRGPEEGPHRADDGFAGMVAGGFRPLRTAVHPHGLAQRRHLPHRRRSRWRRRRSAALRAAQLLARQRQPRQGAPVAVADQAEIRQQDLVGRSDDPHRQCRAGIDGLQDLRLWRRPRRRLGARGRHLLGPRRQVAGRPTLQRRSRPAEPARRRADGPDLCQPGRPERQARSAGVGPRHPRDVCAHGDE